MSLIVDPEAMSLILAWSHTFIEFDAEIFSTIILLLPLTQEGLSALPHGATGLSAVCDCGIS